MDKPIGYFNQIVPSLFPRNNNGKHCDGTCKRPLRSSFSHRYKYSEQIVNLYDLFDALVAVADKFRCTCTCVCVCGRERERERERERKKEMLYVRAAFNLK